MVTPARPAECRCCDAAQGGRLLACYTWGRRNAPPATSPGTCAKEHEMKRTSDGSGKRGSEKVFLILRIRSFVLQSWLQCSAGNECFFHLEDHPSCRSAQDNLYCYCGPLKKSFLYLSVLIKYSLPVERMLTGQNSQLVFDLEVFQAHGTCLLCEQQTGRRQRGSLTKMTLHCHMTFIFTLLLHEGSDFLLLTPPRNTHKDICVDRICFYLVFNVLKISWVVPLCIQNAHSGLGGEVVCGSIEKCFLLSTLKA